MGFRPVPHTSRTVCVWQAMTGKEAGLRGPAEPAYDPLVFELLRMMAETARQAIPSIASARRRQKADMVGASLFLVYVRLNDAILSGHHLIDMLGDYVAAAKRTDRLSLRQWGVAAEVDSQVITIKRLLDAIQALNDEITVLNAGARLRLDVFLKNKWNALDAVLSVLRSDHLLLDSGRLRFYVDTYLEGDFENVSDEPSLRLAIFEGLRAELAVDMSASPPDEAISALEDYLLNGKPREQLIELAQVAEDMRETLEAHFELRDVLPLLSKARRKTGS